MNTEFVQAEFFCVYVHDSMLLLQLGLHITVIMVISLNIQHWQNDFAYIVGSFMFPLNISYLSLSTGESLISRDSARQFLQFPKFFEYLFL